MSQIAYSEIGLEEWEIDAISDTPNDEDVSLALDELSRLKPINSYLYEIAKALTDTGMDWRTSSAPSLSREESKVQSAYRGSSGYTLLQQECYKHLIKSKDPLVVESAKQPFRSWELSKWPHAMEGAKTE